jgi:hypothetical protein
MLAGRSTCLAGFFLISSIAANKYMEFFDPAYPKVVGFGIPAFLIILA